MPTTGTLHAVLDVERAGRQARPGNQDRSGARLGGIADASLDSAVARLHDDCLARDEADAVRTEEISEHVTARNDARSRSDWASVGPATVATSNRAGRAGAAPPRTRTRSSSTVLAPTCSSASASNTSRRASSVPTARASAAAAGAAIVPNPSPGLPSFPTGATTSVPSRVAPAVARASGLSAKAAYGSHATDERDRGGVLDVSVAVGVDGALEPGEEEIAAAQDRPAALGRLFASP